MTSRVSRVVATVVAVAGGIATPQAQDRAQPFQRAVVVTGAGPHRLDADVALVAGAARGRVAPLAGVTAGVEQVLGGLGDLRLVDADGREVPYLLMPPRSDVAPRAAAAQVVRIPATKTTSGFEIALDSAVPVAALDVSGLPAPFMKRVRVEGSVDRAHWVELAAAVTIFDLPGEGLRQTVVPLPSGTQRYLRVVGDDTHSAPLPLPAASAVSVVLESRGGSPAPALTVDVPFRAQTTGSRTRYFLRLPGERLPIVAFRLDAANTTVRRTVRVWPARTGRGEGTVLGQSTIQRVERDGLVAGDLIVPVRPPQDATADIEVDDGSNPPLDLRAIQAVFAHLPQIYFVAPDARPLTAHYGRHELAAPTYDLEAARASVDVDGAPAAAWGPAVASTMATAAATPEVAMAPPVTPVPVFGAPLDRRLFSFARALPPGPAAVAQLRLDAAVLAHSGARAHSLHDLRLADASGRQVPYLLERLDAPLAHALPSPARRQPGVSAMNGNSSVYDITLPYVQLPASQLVVTTTARVFRRHVSLAVEHPPDPRHRDAWTEWLGSQTWSHADDGIEAPPLRFALSPLPATRIALHIDEGDNQPLPLHQATLELPAYRLRFLRPADTALDLLYGSVRVEAPRYDVADLVRSPLASAQDIVAGPERGLEGLPTATLVTPPVFWGVLAMATVVLIGLLVRLMRATREPDVASEPPSSP